MRSEPIYIGNHHAQVLGHLFSAPKANLIMSDTQSMCSPHYWLLPPLQYHNTRQPGHIWLQQQCTKGHTILQWAAQAYYGFKTGNNEHKACALSQALPCMGRSSYTASHSLEGVYAALSLGVKTYPSPAEQAMSKNHCMRLHHSSAMAPAMASPYREKLKLAILFSWYLAQKLVARPGFALATMQSKALPRLAVVQPPPRISVVNALDTPTASAAHSALFLPNASQASAKTSSGRRAGSSAGPPSGCVVEDEAGLPWSSPSPVANSAAHGWASVASFQALLLAAGGRGRLPRGCPLCGIRALWPKQAGSSGAWGQPRSGRIPAQQ